MNAWAIVLTAPDGTLSAPLARIAGLISAERTIVVGSRDDTARFCRDARGTGAHVLLPVRQGDRGGSPLGGTLVERA